jgi:RNA polymerase sigma factor (sigma-70 family)
LVLLSQAGDKVAYRELIELLYPFIRTHLARKVGLSDVNDDITQEAILGVHKGLATYNPRYSFSGWVYAITRYKVIDHFRKVGRDQAKISLSDLGEELADENYQESESKLTSQSKIGQVLESLPECTKKAIILTKLEGRSISETSQLIGISEVALRKRISRAIKSIIRNFENDG